MTRGCGAALIFPLVLHIDFFRTKRTLRICSSYSSAIWCKSVVSSEDQDVRLAPFTTVSNDKVPVAAHGPGLPRGVHVVCKGSGGLLAPVLRLPPDPGGVAQDRRRPPHGDIEGGVLAVSRLQNIPWRN